MARKFKCEGALPHCPLHSSTALGTKRHKVPKTPKSDPVLRRSPSAAGPSHSGAHVLPRVVFPPLSSVLTPRQPSSHHTSQELDELLDSPVPLKKRKIAPRHKLPTSLPPPLTPSCPLSPPSLPNLADYLTIPCHTLRELLTHPVLGRPPNTELVYPKLIVPGTMIDHTCRFALRWAAFWQVDADRIPMTHEGFHQVRSSMAARMAIVHGHEEESCALLATAQANITSTLQLQCIAAEDLELLCQENLLLDHIIDKLIPDSPESPPPAPSSPS